MQFSLLITISLDYRLIDSRIPIMAFLPQAGRAIRYIFLLVLGSSAEHYRSTPHENVTLELT
ncbi:hypothetical protein D1818_21885 [Aquimarina sp. BL5]|nr:hypothetical protein D1818_21885 [Aquimarina sp. BL5]RKN06192.1 hypothetical protein D7036_09395 [Aquimarina sp. BL5]